MESRIKQLREKRGLIQEILAVELGITQQMLSKYERDVTLIKVDILKKIAAYFNVTTDYLLGVSDVKRDLNGQMKMNEVLDEYYDLLQEFRKQDIVEKIRNFIGCQAGFSDHDLLQEIQKFITVHLDPQGIILYMDVLGNQPVARNAYKQGGQMW